ncbi:MAG: acyl-CoA synthetase FdrA [Armatimonadota bacterium]|nr:acyl-CoA synthetase FdrA [Armatimonadota bacterium]MDR7453889.1 acyl-CoA synthetase FdrA [Armatimonadota bacterium]MDR7456688.1 acyl-CoA synthetase FdrA [Armatimonadota bacterium]MDR7495717.1 acyl-CoA synthetase FdrA [Armatimonadota bacterium]
MPVVGIVRRSAYFDSVALMLAQREARELPGVEEAGVVMATEANKALLREGGLAFPDLDRAGPDDLVVAARAATLQQAEAAVARAQEALVRRRETAGGGAYRPKTIAAARRQLPQARLALVSVPGRFARAVAAEALDEGLHVLLFSDNVPLEHEIELKARSRAAGLLLMGPDCGTAIIAGAALGFANRVRAGRIGLVGAAGTGLQEVTSLIHRFGAGITHAIGTGSRDLSEAVGGVTMLQGLRALALDPATAVIVLVSKPPAPAVAATVLAAAAACGKPVVVAFLGAQVAAGGNVHAAVSLEDAARQAVRLVGGGDPGPPALRGLPAQEAARLHAGARYLRGLFSGGTLCYETLVLLRPHIGPIYSNAPLVPEDVLDPVTRSRGHAVVDMGGDEFTQGRLHPMLDPTLRLQRLRQEAADPETAVIDLDVVLGYGAHPDPATALAPVLREVREAARRAGRYLVVVGSVCGTDEDPQDAAAQREVLAEAGMLVEDSNARAARLAGLVLEGRGAPRAAWTPSRVAPAAVPPPWPEVGPIASLLAGRPAVISVGLDLFTESLQTQGVPVVAVDWRPPAGGKPHLMDLLDRLEA